MEKMIGLRRYLLAFCTLVFAVIHTVEPTVCADGPKARVAARVENARPAPTQWLDHVAEFFRRPVVNVALITIGVIGLIFEFKFPGTTFPGSVAAICFVLFFWAYSFVGEFTLLAILLFLLGLVFLGLEVFVLPGIAFCGVAGAGLMYVGLLLVTLENWPRDPNEWTDVGSTFGSIAIGLVLAVLGSFALAWSLPNVPILNRMVLKPPVDEAESPLSLSNSGYVQLLGAIGVAVTHLRPFGKAQFGEQFMDVNAASGYIAPGVRVKVIEIDGQRVVVKEV